MSSLPCLHAAHRQHSRAASGPSRSDCAAGASIKPCASQWRCDGIARQGGRAPARCAGAESLACHGLGQRDSSAGVHNFLVTSQMSNTQHHRARAVATQSSQETRCPRSGACPCWVSPWHAIPTQRRRAIGHRDYQTAMRPHAAPRLPPPVGIARHRLTTARPRTASRCGLRL